jgi:hypothetical protein
MASLFAKKTKTPKVTAPPVMPVPDDTQVQAAEQEAVRKRTASQGRMSTILTDATGVDTLG